MSLNKNQEETPEIDYDGQWKGLMTAYGEEFIRFFFSASFIGLLNLEKGVEPYTEELLKLFPNLSKKGKIIPDKLFRVYRKDGKIGFVIVHVEIEKSPDKKILKRMFLYYTRLIDLFPNAEITAIVVYIGKRVPTVYDVYEYKFGGTEIRYKFNAYVVKHQKEADLIASENPFALAVLACFYAIKGEKDDNKRLFYKRKLTRLCLERNYPLHKIRNLLLFIGFVIFLPKEKEAIYLKKTYDMIKEGKKKLTLHQQNRLVTEFILEHFMSKEMRTSIEEEANQELKATLAELEVEIKLKAAESAAKLKEEIRLKEESAARLKEEIRLKEEAEARLKEEIRLREENQIKKTIKTIKQMALSGLSVDFIATCLEVEEAYVKEVLK